MPNNRVQHDSQKRERPLNYWLVAPSADADSALVWEAFIALAVMAAVLDGVQARSIISRYSMRTRLCQFASLRQNYQIIVGAEGVLHQRLHIVSVFNQANINGMVF